eukprot:TRINITY_DN5848_c0_g1_i2.p1 TRINITY_DN5848_c0_g1~~TRINITY_DN5848_c0_g1_i2.p1  ORF type:complete len:877 (+),score=139.65 TRINITY_DN5848_c0_g1_i2:141-2771(+)
MFSGSRSDRDNREMPGHTAFTLVQLMDKTPLKIESVDMWGDRLLVGSTEGTLVTLEYKENFGDVASGKFILVDTIKAFSKKPVLQLAVIDGLKLLISLSDYVHVHVLGSYRQHSTLTKTKSGFHFVIDRERFPPRLCCAAKRKLIFYEWDGKQFVELREVPVVEAVVCMAWCDDLLCVGFKSRYCLMHPESGQMREIIAGFKSTPYVAVLPGKQLLLGRDDVSIFFDFEGRPTRRFGLKWSEQPTTIGYSFPYVVGVLSKTVEVRTISAGSSSLVQTIPVRNVRTMQIQGTTLYLASQTQIWRLLPVPILTQIDQLVGEQEYEEALTLCESITDIDVGVKAEKIAGIRKRLAIHLFVTGQYERSMEYFAKLQCDPLEVIGLYPNLLPKALQEKYSHPYPMEAPVLAGASLIQAEAALINYLVTIWTHVHANDHGNPLQVEGDYATVTDVATIVDTALLKAYVRTNANEDLMKLVSAPNSCHARESEKILTDKGKLEELAALYQSKGMHRKALEFLAQAGNSNKAGPLNGPGATIRYLSRLDAEYLPLILEFSKWVLQLAPREALQIFTDREPSQKLPAKPVVEHIQALAPNVLTPYLEYAILEGETDPELHNSLILNYLTVLRTLREDNPKPSRPVPAGSEPGLLGALRKKLLVFLETSTHYTPQKILTHFLNMPDTAEERALLFGRIQNHEQALSLYVYDMNNRAAAEAYCAKHYNTESDSRDVYITLLAVYLRPPKGGQNMLTYALDLLNKNYTRIDAPKALETLPESCSITTLAPFFENVIKDRAKNKRDKQVMHSLFKLENLQVQDELISARQGVIKITEKTQCRVCGKRIGTNTAFAQYPNGVLVHYRCCKDRSVCPVTGTVFSKPGTPNH